VGNSDLVGLVTVDGHSTRLQSKVWEDLSKHNLIAICKPPHTSHYTSALDNKPNGQFKYFMQKADSFPNKRNMEGKLPDFIRSISRAAYKGLDPDAIRVGILLLEHLFIYLFFCYT
jgi:hypothetical protein